MPTLPEFRALGIARGSDRAGAGNLFDLPVLSMSSQEIALVPHRSGGRTMVAAISVSYRGVPGGIRTHGPRIRNPVLYPAELRGHALFSTRQAMYCPATSPADIPRGRTARCRTQKRNRLCVIHDSWPSVLPSSGRRSAPRGHAQSRCPPIAPTPNPLDAGARRPR
jgi:hypothetical protein